MNLLQETIIDIGHSGHATTDIIFIGSEQTGHRCSWPEFEALADIEYEKGFGAQKVAKDLIVVFSDGSRMERCEYDGSEWWQYSKPFKRPTEALPIIRLIVPEGLVGWCDLAECNAVPTSEPRT